MSGRYIKLPLQQTSACLGVSSVLMVNSSIKLCVGHLRFFIHFCQHTHSFNWSSLLLKIFICCLNVIDFCIGHPRVDLLCKEVCGNTSILLSTNISFIICEIIGIVASVGYYCYHEVTCIKVHTLVNGTVWVFPYMSVFFSLSL